MQDEFGMLHDQDEIKLLILYVLTTLGRPVTFSQMSDALLGGGGANYFSFTSLFDDLLKNGQVEKLSDDCYQITRLGLETNKLFEKRIPYSIRSHAMNSVTRVLSQIREENELLTDILPASDGYDFCCQAKDGENVLFEVKVNVPSKMQAELMKKEFRRNPYRLFHSVIEALTDSTEAEE